MAVWDGVLKAYAEFGAMRLRDAHWVMDEDSLEQLKAEAGADDDRGPGPDATLMGLPIKVTGDGGQPHLVIDALAEHA